MLTDELHVLLSSAAEAQPFEPDLAPVQGRLRRLRRRRVTGVSAGVAAVIALTAVGALLVGDSDDDRLAPSPADKASAALELEVDNWGPTRGSYSDDQAFLDRVRQEWLEPAGRYYGDPRLNGGETYTSSDGKVFVPPDRSRHLVGDVQILYANQTTDGPAAVVAQRSSNPDTDIYLGLLLPTGQTDLRLVAAYTARMYAQHEFGDRGFDTDMVNFTTDPAGTHLVILPADPDDSVSVSTDHRLGPTGRVQRDWTPVATSGGVATLTVPGSVGFWDTLIRVSHDGDVVDEGTVWDVRGTSGLEPASVEPPAPGNAIEWPYTDQGIAGSVPGGGFPGTLNDVWLTQYAGLDEPYGGRWWVTDSPSDRHPILVEQLWFYGDPAHTVVLRIVGNDVQLLSDTVTDPSDRPLVFQLLPDDLGWLVVAGPDADITGYREAGAHAWSDIDTATTGTTDGKVNHTRKSAFIPSTARHLQVRLEIDGSTRVVDSPSS